ncbi:membrane fusion protein, heavy metal efflux system [Cupriavidus metallidurans]|jgi:cobalt-zinc-cadmium efflux system membrane fusion protein|uniref:Heavy metal cation tricomponent efflux, membrane fusion protein HmyB (CzcB-like) n=1 Tax=Cupriavidus metallidurans (strain ATCC 43123 / DSM 2839 / NBRC 102507 / CH34) TaxID=266264 RepID=Q1LFT8_CUPMC|nr:efflux RND transporter periplasmic adaptor subunit [Cupriavidus metallidurans]ABF10988.1 heavy metal cation tricomponent efflux, membrane fusion protein HmyB (CzcB-like) [Cupriavidus metallidurans CH34]AVA34846.1 efflux RND transporter periplasmic adaptor subunit [Cupriavidus metallidurans]KWW39532.1 Cobalt-zinc-cadmium resistance protein CzcB [Cupriavidus metallidurans]MDE4920749.1 efflux RND transporter periplasmic adaptor subunit [Cupriavidus metallidurans]QGS32953.1 efflux RND transport
MRPQFLLSFAAAAVMMLSLAGCSDDPAPAAEAPKLPPGIVKPEENLKRTLKVAPVAASPFSEMLRVAGRIDFDEQRVSRIGASVTGRVTDLYAVLGQEVKAGQVLARLHSSELGAAQMAFLKAEAQNTLQARNAERARQLFAADVIGRAELQRRESEYAIAAAEARAYRDQLRVLGMSAASIATLAKSGSIESYSPVFSSINGTVVERNVAQGQVVQPADALYTVADLSRVWVVAEVPEQQAAQVAEGQSVDIEVPSLANSNGRITGKLIYVGRTVNPQSRTVLVRTELQNKDGRLKPAMLATMLIAAKPVELLVVPGSAVVREGNDEQVYVEVGDGQYRLTKVKLGPESDGMRVVQSGIKPGDRVVVEGAFHLDNERKQQEQG